MTDETKGDGMTLEQVREYADAVSQCSSPENVSRFNEAAGRWLYLNLDTIDVHLANQSSTAEAMTIEQMREQFDAAWPAHYDWSEDDKFKAFSGWVLAMTKAAQSAMRVDEVKRLPLRWMNLAADQADADVYYAFEKCANELRAALQAAIGWKE